MNSRKTPKTHLVPVIKGVSDPAKGLIFRTYHVRPEQLQKSLKQATSKPEKTHIQKITNYEKLNKSILTNDITHLRGMFSSNSKVWDKLVIRNNRTSPSSNRSKQKLMQSIYAYALSQDAMFTTSIKTHAREAVNQQAIKVEHNEGPQKHTSKNPKSTAVHEQVSYKPAFADNDELLTPVVLPVTQNKAALTVAKGTTPEQDFGKILTKQKIITPTSNHIPLSGEVSAFINLLNLPVNKVATIHSTLKGKADVDDGLSKNLILRPHIYKKNPEYWIDELSNELSKYMRGENENMTPESAMYHSLILKDMDKKRFYEIYESYPDDRIAYATSNRKVDEMLYDGVLNTHEASLVVASLEGDAVLEYKTDILGLVKDLHYDGKDTEALALFSAYSNSLTSDVAFRLLNTMFPGKLTFKNIVSTVNEKDDTSPFEYVLLQMIISKVSGTHYIPYDNLQMFNGSPFLPNLILKIFTIIMQNKTSEIVNFIKARRSISQEDIRVGVRAPKARTEDKQLFIRMLPAMKIDVLQEGASNTYAATGKIAAYNTLAINESTVLAMNPISTIIFDSLD